MLKPNQRFLKIKSGVYTGTALITQNNTLVTVQVRANGAKALLTCQPHKWRIKASELLRRIYHDFDCN